MNLANLAVLLNSVVFFIIGISLFILIIKVANFVESVGNSLFPQIEKKEGEGEKQA